MKVLILIVLLGLLLPGESEALTCYNCADCSTPSSPLECPSAFGVTAKYCLKSVVSYQGRTSVSRTCSPICVDAGGTQNSAHTKISCCQTDRCNTATMTSFSVTLIMMPLLMAYIIRERF